MAFQYRKRYRAMRNVQEKGGERYFYMGFNTASGIGLCAMKRSVRMELSGKPVSIPQAVSGYAQFISLALLIVVTSVSIPQAVSGYAQ